MITRRIRIQLVVFSTLGLIATCLIVFQYARVPALLGIGQTRLEADFASGGGLYANANVTYRGVTVGRVTGLHLTPNGAQADLSVSTSAHIPRNVSATIKSMSAIGEQYVDLVPKSQPGSQLLANGDVIGIKDTYVPIPIARVLDSVDALLKSVPETNLTTVLNEAELGFRGLAPSLRQLSTDTQALVSAASASYPATHALIQDAAPVLDTQLASSSAIRAWASQLNGFTRALTRSNPQLESLFRTVPPAANSVSGLLTDLSRQAPSLISTADVSARLLKAYYPAVEQVLSVYPLVSAADIASDAHPENLFGLSFKTIANYPGGCSTGWPKAGQPYGPRPSYVITDEASAPNAYCRIAQSDPRVVRGARNLQCFEPGSPPGRRAATIDQCRGSGYNESAAPFKTIMVPNPAAPIATPLLAMFGNAGQPPSTGRPASWTQLLTRGLVR